MGLIDVSCQFKQCCRAKAWGRWTWRMRWGGSWVSSQCNYFLGREIDHRRFCSVALRMPCPHDSDHRAVVAKIYSGAEKKLKAYRECFSKFPIRLPQGPQGELETMFEELRLDIAPPPLRGKDPKISGYLIAHGCSSINGWHFGELGSSTSAEPASLEDASKLL
jgi:hypothetical protein